MLKANGVKFLEVSGNITPSERVKRLKQFRASGRDGERVLILSNVGSVGLNIACANIVIIVVRSLKLYEGALERRTAVGRTLVCAERATAHWARVETPAAEDGAHLPAHRDAIS